MDVFFGGVEKHLIDSEIDDMVTCPANNLRRRVYIRVCNKLSLDIGYFIQFNHSSDMEKKLCLIQKPDPTDCIELVDGLLLLPFTPIYNLINSTLHIVHTYEDKII